MSPFSKNPSKSLFLILALTLLSVLWGCSGKSVETVPNGSDAKVDLTISAAASLTDSLQEIKSIYEKNNKSVQLNLNLGGSGALQQQIEQGAPADIFISASAKNMKLLVDGHLIDQDQQQVLLHNELVLVTPKTGSVSVTRLADLQKPEFTHISIGEPGVPAGDYTREALAFYKIGNDLQAKLVPCKDVRQVLTYVESGNAEAGFVYKTDALTTDQVKIALTVDPQSYKAIEYPVGIVKATRHPKEAADFYHFLQGAEARAVFQKYGFSLPK
ncbi:molybdate ABC transporter substrate-binding protein [Ferviditalea candida]|uniref:Molybdate ABC transporter substrate-binding protein n=1 Tax=Ferviditalea candida TaxID=3108399 RepID=A0ABU5ZM54_9BACL|nr:molybdate ABC transporter substrate-binding protein [Paenibacillaceae bacterium T2]